MDEISSGKRIFFWSADSSGCAHYRCELPAAELARRGHETHTASVMSDEWLHTADVIVGQRVCQPGATVRWQQMAREGRCALVYEVDDDLLDVEPTNGPAWSFFSRPEIRANVIRNIEVADLVTVSRERLAEVMSKRNRNVMALPNCVHHRRWGRAPGHVGQPHEGGRARRELGSVIRHQMAEFETLSDAVQAAIAAPR